MSTITSTDEATRNVDAENAPVVGARESDTIQIDPAESIRARKWLDTIKYTRDFDAEVRKLFARDRKYARAESSSSVTHSLIQAYIDILVAFLAARNPDFDVLPAETVGEAGRENAELYGKTMEIVIGSLLRRAKLKRAAARWVRSALSVGIGWLKVTWQEITESDPHTKGELDSVREAIRGAEAMRRALAEGAVYDQEAALAELQEREAALVDRMERVIAKGMDVAMIRPENMLVSIDAESVLDAEDADWMGEEFYTTIEQATTDYPRIPVAMLTSAAKFSPRLPGRTSNTSGIVSDLNPADASNFTEGGDSASGSQRFIRGYEVWDGKAEQYLTLLEGVSDRYARPPVSPLAETTRFYPYFGLSFTEVDGERQPQSLTQRTASLQDEIDRTLQNLVTHRKRVKPYLIFDARMITRETADKLKNGTTGERIPVRTVGGKDVDLRRLFFPVQYNAIDMALYDISGYIRCMETQWGIQEALTSTVQVAKTATEADIQQAGTQAKTGHKRDTLEDVLTEIGLYTAQIASQRLTVEDVQALAGVKSLWVQVEGPDMLEQVVTCEVRAGSSGKPDTDARRQAWAAQLAQIEKFVMAIADMRQTPPLEVADCLEELLFETGERLGERIDMTRFIPQPPESAIVDPATGQPMSNSQLGAMQQAQAGQQQAGAGEGKPPKSNPDASQTDESAQDRVAPTDVPPVIAG